MTIRRALLALGLCLGLSTPAAFTAADSASAAGTRTVMTWVAPYAIARSTEMLNTFYGAAGPKNALTHLGLQFWVPSASGGLARSARYGAVSDATVQQFVAWGDANGVKTLLTVYNGEYGWDWNLAKNAFGANRTTFINALVLEMQTRKLDGIDLDLEGVDLYAGHINQDRLAFLAFVKTLAIKVHAKGKVLTIDTFPYIWNGPNQTWWKDLFPHADMINSMGYEDLGMRGGPEAWRRYTQQKAAAGGNLRKLAVGMPSSFDAWQNNTAYQQVDYVRRFGGTMGVAIWDAQLLASTWRKANVWMSLKTLGDTVVP